MDERMEKLRKLIRERKDCLYPYQLEILCLRCGMTDGVCHSEEEIAGLQHITPRQVRWVERAAVRRMIKNLKPKSIRDFCALD